MNARKWAYTMGGGVIGALLVLSGFLAARVLAQPGLAAGESAGAAAVAPKVHYQGRLLDPSTGQPKPDGTYTMLFGLYTTSTGGSPLWTETKDVTVSKGIFSTLLGDTTPLTVSIFNGQDLWLGVTVGSDPQLAPRQPIAFVPYAVYANNADLLDGYNSSSFASSSHSHSVLPRGYGYVSQYTGLRPGSYNVDSVTWSATYLRYEITLTGFYYSIDDVTVATILGDAGNCPAGAIIRTGSVSGKLLVYILNSAGDHIQCSFHFATFAGQ